MGNLEGKVAIITGASRGIGTTIAQLFAAEGARVVCTARTLNEGDHMLEGSLAGAVGSIRAAGGEATAIAADISEASECERLVNETRAIYGPCDVLVNNAALTYFLPVLDIAPNRWLRSFAVTVHGPFVLSRLVLPEMIERHAGAIVNISSRLARGPGRGPYAGPPRPPGATLYGAAKAALERFTQGLAEEVFPYGITVACVSPSQVVATPGTVHHKLVTGMDDPRAEAPAMMARAALLLATESPAKVSGRVTYSQKILKEFGWVDQARGYGLDQPGSGFSEI